MITEIFTAIGALLFVISLLGLFAWGVRRFGLAPGQGVIKSGKKQIEILETKMLDGRNRLVSVRWHDKDYLITTNPAGAKLIAARDGQENEQFRDLIGDNENS